MTKWKHSSCTFSWLKQIMQHHMHIYKIMETAFKILWLKLETGLFREFSFLATRGEHELESGQLYRWLGCALLFRCCYIAILQKNSSISFTGTGANRADSRFAPSQRKTALLCNDISRWLGASLESALAKSSPVPVKGMGWIFSKHTSVSGK